MSNIFDIRVEGQADHVRGYAGRIFLAPVRVLVNFAHLEAFPRDSATIGIRRSVSLRAKTRYKSVIAQTLLWAFVTVRT